MVLKKGSRPPTAESRLLPSTLCPLPSAAHALTTKRRAFQRALGTWFDREQRKLPWREPRSVYRTVVSEFMLQQTQVATVLPYFERWMQALPDFDALAAANEGTVLKLWEGLGYYRRARFLHKLARELKGRETLPGSAAEWKSLTGIGEYTAAAIASISHGEVVASVDGNVIRILARLTGANISFPNGGAAIKRFSDLARTLLDERTPGRHNEAMMELGATICTKRKPACTVCPVAKFCQGRIMADVESIPRIARPAAERREVDRAWIERKGKLLLHRIPTGSARMEGLYELPTLEQVGIDIRALPSKALIATRKRAITRFQITERIHRVSRKGETLENDLHWIPLAEIAQIPLSGPHRRWVESLLADNRNYADEPRG